MHRIFTEGRKIFISKPINHFQLTEAASCSWLLAAGIGVTPLIAMAHRLHAIGAKFEFHYSCQDRKSAAFVEQLRHVPWADGVQWHVSSEDSRLDIESKLAEPVAGTHIYTCGPDRYISTVLDVAERNGWLDEQVHREFFTVPEEPEYENFPFVLRLQQSKQDVHVRADQTATDALLQAGIAVDVKCSDGLCGVCRCELKAGDVEHRDFVLSKTQRKNHIILCQSRAEKPNGVIEVVL